jgi:N-acetylglutamate synthase-like GNAT family acetyltransferase
MVKIRKAQPADHAAILEIINQHDLAYPTQTLDNFWVAEEKGQVVGIADLWHFRGFFFLSSVGVSEGHQHQGIATELLNTLLAGVRWDIYIFTVMPEFFRRFGFEVTAQPPRGLPPRTIFNCGNCTPVTCVCMRRQATHDT